MTAQWIASTVVILHLAFILFVTIGGALLVRWPRMAWVHLPAVCWAGMVELAGWQCPLTPIENHYRVLAGQEAYAGDFIMRYLLPMIYPAGLTVQLQMMLGIGVIVINLFFYARWRKRGAGQAGHRDRPGGRR